MPTEGLYFKDFVHKYVDCRNLLTSHKVDGIVNMHRIKSDKASVTMKTFRAVLILYTVNQNWKFNLKNLTARIRILWGFFRAKASNDCQYRGVAQRAIFTGKVHKPPLGVNVNYFKAKWVQCIHMGPSESLRPPKNVMHWYKYSYS